MSSCLPVKCFCSCANRCFPFDGRAHADSNIPTHPTRATQNTFYSINFLDSCCSIPDSENFYFTNAFVAQWIFSTCINSKLERGNQRFNFKRRLSDQMIRGSESITIEGDNCLIIGTSPVAISNLANKFHLFLLIY